MIYSYVYNWMSMGIFLKHTQKKVTEMQKSETIWEKLLKLLNLEISTVFL